MPVNGITESWPRNFTENAREKRLKLLSKHQDILTTILDEICANPHKDSKYIKVLSKDEIFIYENPDPPLEIIYQVDNDKKIVYFINFAEVKIRVSQ